MGHTTPRKEKHTFKKERKIEKNEPCDHSTIKRVTSLKQKLKKSQIQEIQKLKTSNLIPNNPSITYQLAIDHVKTYNVPFERDILIISMVH